MKTSFRNHNYLAIVIALVIGYSISTQAHALTTITPSFVNAVQYIKTIFVTNNGNSTGILGVKIDGTNSQVWADIYCNKEGENCIPSVSIGDIKQGIQSSDHYGWIKLDGRAISSLTATQQAAANSLGMSGNISDATNTYLVQNNDTLGSNTGNNTRTISQNQLPNVALGGSTNSAGAHNHTYTASETDGAAHPVAGGSKAFSTQTWSANTSSAGAHAHTITTDSINGGVTQQTINIQPKSMSVSTFVYLGQ